MRWSPLRRTTQLLALAGFLILAWATAAAAAQGFRTPPLADALFLIDPVTVLGGALGGAWTLGLILGGVIAIGLALIVGRAFCGWLCPLGTLLDLVRRATAPLTRWLHRRTNRRSGRLVAALANGPLVVLTIGVVAGLLGLPLLGLADPFGILLRALASGLFPWSDQALTAWQHAQFTGDHVPASGIIDDYRFIGAPVRSVTIAYAAGWAAVLTLAGIAVLELIQPRFWCRTLCPTGGLLGLFARWSLVRRLPGGPCGSCRACVHTCHLGAFDAQGKVIASACTACMRCVDDCPEDTAAFSPAVAPAAPVDASRRGFLVACALGAAAPLLGGTVAGSAARRDPFRLRPPGAATDDGDFLAACVRCGECTRACPSGALHPALLADGLPGLFAPRLVPRLSACEHDCAACGSVCPTGAIPRRDLADRRTQRMGVAIHDHARCLPWSGAGECRVCWEHCPVTDKAITLKLGRAPNGQAIPMPGVDAERCIGCGTCEFVCPIEGDAGIRVVALAEAEPMRKKLQP